jgi:hypothetical protein
MDYAKKLAPLAAVLAVMIYCMTLGTTVAGSKKSNKPPEKLPEFKAELFAPKLPPRAKRNPFYLPGEEPTVIVEAAPKDKKAAPAKIDNVAAAKEYFSGLVLNATYLVGERRLATINGHIYKEKDKLNSSEPQVPTFVVSQILPYEVVLECGGQLFHLRYSDVYAGAKINPIAKSSDTRGKPSPQKESKVKPATPKGNAAPKANS